MASDLRIRDSRFLVNPVVLSGLIGLNLSLLEPESDFLLGVLDTITAVADVAANIDCVVWGG